MKKLLSILFIFSLIGCTKHGTVFVTGTLNQWSHVNILLLSSPMVSTASGDVNGNPLTAEFDGWEVHLTSDIPISTGATYTINIITDEGTGKTTVIVPSDFTITSPVNDTTISPNSNVSLEWSSSVNANWYKIDIHHSLPSISDTTFIVGDTTNLILPGACSLM